MRTVVIDPGHGGENPGRAGRAARSRRTWPSSIARKLRAELVNARGLTVFLTRDRDADVALDERTAIANNYKADLFVSIHANASRARGAKGSEVYFLSYQASDDESRRVAQAEGAAEPSAGAAPGSDLALILWDMAQAEHLEESSALASRIQEELAVVTGSEGRGVKQAPFRVLVGAADARGPRRGGLHQQPRGGEAAGLRRLPGEDRGLARARHRALPAGARGPARRRGAPPSPGAP